MDTLTELKEPHLPSLPVTPTHEKPGPGPDSLRIATEHYHWKPGKAVFHSFELEEYGCAGVRLGRPVLDLGCADGTFGAMLREKGIVDGIDLALEYSAEGLKRVNETVAWGAVQGDARALPLKSGSLASVVANGVICSVRTNVDRSLMEIHRVLADPGLFVMTVPTARVDETQLVPKLLRKAGLSNLARRYLERLNRRLVVYHRFAPEVWRQKLEEAGFRVEQLRYFFTPRQALWTNLLTLQLFRVVGLSKHLGARGLQRRLARLEERSFRGLFESERSLPEAERREQAGYILIVARKSSPAAARKRESAALAER